MRRLLLVVLLVGAGCSGPGTREILVSSAASLTDAFAAIEIEFESAHPEYDVVLNVGGSSALREQILAGAPADVFASANLANMDVIAAAGLTVEGPVVFARNHLEIAVPPENPGNVIGLDDFDDPDLLLGLCAPAVPCGVFARQVLQLAGIEPALDTNEPDVRALLTKIQAGELDAGIVYATDVSTARGAVAGIPIPAESNITADYPIAALSGGSNPVGATAFVDFVASPAGQLILFEHGFVQP